MYSTLYSYPIVMELDFIDGFSKNIEISNFMKIRPEGAELFHADRRTDMTNQIAAFRNFFERAVKIVSILAVYAHCFAEIHKLNMFL